MNFVNETYKIQANTIIKNLNKRFMEGYYCKTKEEAKTKVLSLISENSSVSWGGSMTLDEIGIKEALGNKNLNVINRDNGKTPEEKKKLMKDALTCDYFLTSTNAITLDGELINIDGNANRVAAICFGPENVIVVAGMNKVVANVETGIDRVHTNACAPNCIRFNLKNPCSVTGKCTNCIDTSICAQMLITRLSKVHNRIKVVLVGESLGF
ncbi:lactate utilization protein [Sedimentibacter sp. zth1]|uniref:lactate utilization protein n=1 Tax=Sedimentibacter sp. zth1 TaxID=2816908 RepID=UPI001A9125D6|nr:lactate utilization protein [Sedimentibacter sp. zth1]QSX06352.1 lactate utilization protein [Sedimentibacter sp. zth1]